MNESKKHQQSRTGTPSVVPKLGHSCSGGVLPKQTLNGFLMAAAVASLSLTELQYFSQAQEGSGKPLPQAPQEPAAKFAPPPDPSNLPALLPLPPERSSAGSLDLLPSFPSQRPSPNPLDLVVRTRENPSLVPDGPNPTEDAAVSLSQRHRFQLARVKALNDVEVQKALAVARKAGTDRELRAAMSSHYTLLFKKMREVDASLESLIRERETAALKPLQGNTRPTVVPEKN